MEAQSTELLGQAQAAAQGEAVPDAVMLYPSSESRHSRRTDESVLPAHNPWTEEMPSMTDEREGATGLEEFSEILKPQGLYPKDSDRSGFVL